MSKLIHLDYVQKAKTHALLAAHERHIGKLIPNKSTYYALILLLLSKTFGNTGLACITWPGSGAPVFGVTFTIVYLLSQDV